MKESLSKVGAIHKVKEIARAAGLALVLQNALTACSTPPREEPRIELADKEGRLVPTSEILAQRIPIEEWKVLDLQSHPVVIVVDKQKKLFGVFEKGNLVRVGVASTARTKLGYGTPNGEYPITRLEGAGYTSREYPGAKMDYASFFGPTGRAFHASSNFQWRYNKDREMKEWYVLLDNSHGCVNLLDSDAQAINELLRTHSMKGKAIIRG